MPSNLSPILWSIGFPNFSSIVSAKINLCSPHLKQSLADIGFRKILHIMDKGEAYVCRRGNKLTINSLIAEIKDTKGFDGYLKEPLSCRYIKSNNLLLLAGVDISVRHSLQPLILSSIVQTIYPAIQATEAVSQFSKIF